MTLPHYTRGKELPAILEQRIAILDGAMGTMIQRFKLTEAQYRGARFANFARDVKGNNELLSLTRPDVIRDIHEGYLAAGADLIETNTFGATSIAQDDYGMGDLAYEMNLESARLARAACDKFSTPDKPRFVCGALGAALMRPYIQELAKAAPDTFISCYPNAGLPNPMSDTGFDETPEVTSRLVHEFAAEGLVNILGGCCGTTPDHIGAIARAVAPVSTRKLFYPDYA